MATDVHRIHGIAKSGWHIENMFERAAIDHRVVLTVQGFRQRLGSCRESIARLRNRWRRSLRGVSRPEPQRTDQCKAAFSLRVVGSLLPTAAAVDGSIEARAATSRRSSRGARKEFILPSVNVESKRVPAAFASNRKRPLRMVSAIDCSSARTSITSVALIDSDARLCAFAIDATPDCVDLNIGQRDSFGYNNSARRKTGRRHLPCRPCVAF